MRKALLISSLFITLVFALLSCEREIDIALESSGTSIVVEGIIEPGAAPRILITKNRGFFANFPADVISLLDTFIVRDAIVIVSDGSVTDTLDFIINPFEYPFAYYTSSVITGEVGKTYTLEVRALGQTAYSSTTIPPPVAVDSLYFGLNVFDAEADSQGFAYIQYTDPDTLGNAYRLYSKRNGEPQFFPVNGQIANDEFINGRTITFFTGQSTKPFGVQDTFIEEDFFYLPGDTVYIKFCSIGMREYEFYNTFEAARGNNGNPFSSPALIKSNIRNGLGVWCGQSYFLDTLIVTQ
jgi:hypothetical protein